MPRRPPKAELVKLARELGAVRGKRINWYKVAEHLARTHRPDLIGPAVPAKSKRDDFYLVQDVQATVRQKKCSISKACDYLASGYLPHEQMVTRFDGSRVSVRFASENWARQKRGSLNTRYHEFLKAARRPEKKLY